jgi:hypothetical protein
MLLDEPGLGTTLTPDQLKVPTYLGQLPALMGDTAGGSLTADQWLIAAIAVCPIAVSLTWLVLMHTADTFIGTSNLG